MTVRLLSNLEDANLTLEIGLTEDDSGFKVMLEDKKDITPPESEGRMKGIIRSSNNLRNGNYYRMRREE